jgi:hypothetical protein
MTTVATSTTDLQLPDEAFAIDDAQLAAVAFLARYHGRTLDAYRHDLRGFFQWASDNNLAVLAATRPHIELYRSWMEDRGLAASTIDRRLSTVCGPREPGFEGLQREFLEQPALVEHGKAPLLVVVALKERVAIAPAARAAHRANTTVTTRSCSASAHRSGPHNER